MYLRPSNRSGKMKHIIHVPQRAALLISGGTGISSSDFLTLLKMNRSKQHEVNQIGET
jgi:molybdopterin biosynthesis enzyme MoaB